MSLKAFHIIFILLSIALAAGCAVWGIYYGASPIFVAACIIFAAGLAVYGVWFLKKTKKIIL